MRSQHDVERLTRLSARQIETRANYGIIPERKQRRRKGQRGSFTEVSGDTVERLSLLNDCLGKRRTLHAEACELFLRFYPLPKPERIGEVLLDYLDGWSELAFGWKKSAPGYPAAYRERESIKRHVEYLARDPAISLLGAPEVIGEVVSGLLWTFAGVPEPGTLESRAGWPSLGVLKHRARDASAPQLDHAAACARERLQRDEKAITTHVSTHFGDSAYLVPALSGHVCKVPHTLLHVLLPFATLAELAPARTAEERSRLGQSLTSELSGLYPIHSALTRP